MANTYKVIDEKTWEEGCTVWFLETVLRHLSGSAVNDITQWTENPA